MKHPLLLDRRAFLSAAAALAASATDIAIASGSQHSPRPKAIEKAHESSPLAGPAARRPAPLPANRGRLLVSPSPPLGHARLSLSSDARIANNQPLHARHLSQSGMA